MNLVKAAVPLLFVALLLAPPASRARTDPAVCAPCGEWQLDAAASQPVEAAINAALEQYKEPRPPRRRAMRGDLDSETNAEFQASLDEPPPGPNRRTRLRENLRRLLQSPATLRLRQDREDIVIEAQGGPTRRVTPGEPHARVDELGTARIASKWRNPNTLTVTEKYSRKTENREIYALAAAKRVLHVTRSVSRQGLPAVTVHSTYVAR